MTINSIGCLRSAGRRGRIAFALAFGTMMAPCAAFGGDGPAVTTAREIGPGRVRVDIVYFRDLGCTFIKEVREQAPANIDPPKRSLVVTVTLDRKGDECALQQKADPIIRQSIEIADRPGTLSVDIFYQDPDGRFVRSQKPRIYRGADEAADLD